jgi:hypothetical protein
MVMFSRNPRRDIGGDGIVFRHSLTLGRVLTTVLALSTLASCATGSRLHPDPATPEDANVLRVTQVAGVATRQEIVATGDHYKYLLASGVADSDLVDGGLIEGRIYCCGGPNESGTAMWVFVPRGLQVERGDILEVRMGRAPSGGDPGKVNTALRVRQKASESGPCRWIPEDPKLWVRYLYCPWMEQEGWKERGGLYPAWVGPGVGLQ